MLLPRAWLLLVAGAPPELDEAPFFHRILEPSYDTTDVAKPYRRLKMSVAGR